ncbi:rhomboid protease ROM10 [Plasmodium gonderi]|uniref:Rhomboid-like protease n=1 Tax=Plasmodium gonderi TaxID=77519 RepID=A0A1Y1JH52_PLAGO|nr:rhomboid protease ROM10 [Plasmodium gonderi]GAW81841.1 rhomboid protease ROM10 [Plasmodium gonderi]
MNFFSNSYNNSRQNESQKSKLLICKYTRSFSKTFKKDIKFIQILFPSLIIKSITTLIFLFLFLMFIILDVYYFDRHNPLFLNEDVMKKFGMSRISVTNNHQYYRILTATFFHSNVWNLIINAYYLMNIGIIVEKNYGKRHYATMMLLSALCGNLLMCATSNCSDMQMGISTILYGFMGLFLQEIVDRRKELTDMWNIFGNYIFALLSLYLTVNMFPFNGNFIGNFGGLFGGFCYPYLLKRDTFHGEGKKLRIIFSILLILLLISTIVTLIVAKC